RRQTSFSRDWSSDVCSSDLDPVTNGHLDIIDRTCRLYDEVIVAVLVNESKRGLFEISERLEMLREVTAPYPNVRVESFQGLLVETGRASGRARAQSGAGAVA